MIDIKDTYAFSLRGNEGFRIDITELFKLLEMKKGKSQKIPLFTAYNLSLLLVPVTTLKIEGQTCIYSSISLQEQSPCYM